MGVRTGAVHPAAEISYTAERALRALEVLALRPSTAPAVADVIGAHPRTARRILRTLVKERYVERRQRCGRRAHVYEPTVRLLAMAGQLAARLELVQDGRRGAEELRRATGLSAYVAVPSYADVLVIARAGDCAPQMWALLPAAEHAAGRLLLAYRDNWRHSVNGDRCEPIVSDGQAAAIRARGHALVASQRDQPASLAVAVPNQEPPIAALVLQGTGDALIADEVALALRAHRTATRMTTGGASVAAAATMQATRRLEDE
jgi:DNA-binding IclR family transcriptional regulator